MKVKAPKGYHWMKSGNNFKLMKDPSGGFKPHKGATKSANFAIQKAHKGKQGIIMYHGAMKPKKTKKKKKKSKAKKKAKK